MRKSIEKTMLIDDTCEKISSYNPLHVIDVDHGHRGSLNSIFGDKIVGTRVPSIAAQFQYGTSSDGTVIDTVDTGSAGFSSSMLTLNTGIGATGHCGVQSADYVRYIPGHEAYAFFTAVFTTPASDSVQRAGLFDYDSGNGNGFFIGYEGTQFGVTRRRSGVDTFQAVDIASVFPEDSGVFDPTKGNVYKISYGYLGFATIHFEVLLPEAGFVALAKFNYPNSNVLTHIANTNIPLRSEVTNSGNTSDLQISIGSVSAGIVDGGGTDPMARVFTQALGTTILTPGVTAQIAHFRNKTTFFGITNKITSQLILISAATDGNKPVAFGIEKNATITTPGTWTDSDADSVIEYSTDAVVTLGTGKDLLLWNMARSDSFFEDVEKYLVTLRPNEWATFYALSSTGNDVDLSIRWKDLF